MSQSPPYIHPRHRRAERSGHAVGLLGLTLLAAWLVGAGPTPTAEAQGIASRQVTLFGILASPMVSQDSPVIDPKLEPIATQLNRLFPGHDFKLVGVETQRVPTGQSLNCDFGGGYSASAQLTDPLDANGKAQLRFQLSRNGGIDFATIVNTPINQLFFLDKRLPDGSKLIMGIGVRE